jgi:UDP-2-acetamido-3-amino-2,3-dideoxy-glucuronate N-acetyltransferase
MIHKRASVSEDAKLGKGCKVWQYASVIRHAELGENCTVAANAIVDGATLGSRCIVGHGAGIHPGAHLGDDVFVGPGAVLCNDAWPRTHKRGFDAFARSVTVENGASIGANAVILPGVRIGVGAMIAAGSIVSKDVPHRMLHYPNGAMQPITDEEDRVSKRSTRRGPARAAA